MGSGILQAAPEEAHTLTGMGQAADSEHQPLARQPGHQHQVS